MQGPPLPPARTWRRLLELAVEEDVGPGDLTTRAVVEPNRQTKAIIEPRAPLVACGIDIAAAVFHQLDPATRFEQRTAVLSKARRRHRT